MTTPAPGAPWFRRIGARWIGYVVLLSPLLINLITTLLTRGNAATDVTSYVVLAEAWRVSLMASLIGVPAAALIAVTDARRS